VLALLHFLQAFTLNAQGCAKHTCQHTVLAGPYWGAHFV
jgi:hypothetical protein